MRVCEGSRHIAADLGGLGDAEALAAVKKVAQCSPGEEFEHQVGRALGLAPVKNLNDVRVIERCDGFGFGMESADEGGIGAQAFVEELDGDLAPER